MHGKPQAHITTIIKNTNVDRDRSRTSSFPSKHWVISCILAHVTITASINLDLWNAFRHTIETTAHGTPHSHLKHLVMVRGEGFPRLLRHQHPFDRKNCFTSNSFISIEFPLKTRQTRTNQHPKPRYTESFTPGKQSSRKGQIERRHPQNSPSTRIMNLKSSKPKSKPSTHRQKHNT